MNVRATIPLPLTREDRRRLEATIEQLVSLLDDVDGDADCEDCDIDVDLANSFCDREDDGISSGEEDGLWQGEYDPAYYDNPGFIWGGGEGGGRVHEGA